MGTSEQVERRWLWDTAAELVAVWVPAEPESGSAASTSPTPSDRELSDVRRYQAAYDQLLWEIVTSTRHELAAFAATFHDPFHEDLPPPLKVAAWRLLGLEPESDLDAMRDAVCRIGLYCSPEEEHAAVSGIQMRIEAQRRSGKP